MGKILVAVLLIVQTICYSYDNQRAREEKEQTRKELHSALKSAVIYGNIEQIKRLLASGADKDGTDLNGHTTLHIAVKYGQLPKVKFLVEVGAEVNTVNNKRVSPLHTAYQNQRDDVVEFLLKKGADTAVVDELGKTPEMYRVKKNSFVNSVKKFMG